VIFLLKLLGEMVRHVVAILILASFVEMLLPSSEINRYVRLVIGLFVVVAVLTPVVSLLNNRTNWEVEAWDQPVQEEQFSSILAGGKALSDRSREVAVEQYYRQLERQIEAITQLIPGVEQVQVKVQAAPETDGNDPGVVPAITVEIKMNKGQGDPGADLSITASEPGAMDGTKLQAKVTATVSDFFNMLPEQVQVVLVD
jgi:stage III sporulation protein AF